MKIKFLLWSIAGLMLSVAASCSKGADANNLLDRIPADADVVAVGNVRTMVESVGGSIEDGKIKLPSSLTNDLDSKMADGLDDFNSFLKSSGINPDACAMTMNFKSGERPIIIFAIDDKKKFQNVIEDEGYREKDDEDGVVYYSKLVYESSYNSDYNDYSYLAVTDSYAYWVESVWVGSSFKPMRAIKRLISNAAEEPFSKTAFAKYITSGNAAGLSLKVPKELKQEMRKMGVSSDLADLYQGVVCFKGDLDGDKVRVDMKLFDEDGGEKDSKALSKFMNANAKINKDALSFFGKDEALVMAASFQGIDWEEYCEMIADAGRLSRSERSAMTAVQSYLQKLDGTVAVGFGLTNGIESIFDLNLGEKPLKQISFTIVVEAKEGKAKSLMNDIKGLLESEDISFEETTTGFNLNFTPIGSEIYAQTVDNFIVISNHKITKNSENAAAKAVRFNDYIGAAALVVNHDNELMRDLGLKNDVKSTFTFNVRNMEMNFMAEINGGSGKGFFGKLIKMVSDIVEQESELDRRFEKRRREVRGNSSYYDYYDDDVVEAVVVEDVDSVAYAVEVFE